MKRFQHCCKNDIGCKERAAGNQKFFDPTIFQKCCRGVGEQPTFAEQIRFCNLFFLGVRIFCKVIFRCNCSTGTVARYLFTTKVSQGGAVLFAPPRKVVAFLTTRSVCQKHGTGISLPAACFRNTTRIRFSKAGAHPQLALGIAIAPETLSFITTF